MHGSRDRIWFPINWWYFQKVQLADSEILLVEFQLLLSLAWIDGKGLLGLCSQHSDKYSRGKWSDPKEIMITFNFFP